ncbi:MAG: bifunctional 2-keto-4-hydroxyglutarate aldolase/2-keto-3-deoxy-6-phosphogluconate aldolase, partial [Oscillospiraceae bacterium]
MLIKEDVIKRIKDDGVVAVVRAASESEAKRIVEKCVAGGLTSIELTFTVPFAHKIIESLAVSYGNQILLGAGTVLDSETARIAILSGANFIVSPHFNADTVRLCNRYRIATMAGIMTITEAVTAMEAGTDILKLFP